MSFGFQPTVLYVMAELALKEVLCTRLGSKGPLNTALTIQGSDELIRPDKSETAVHGSHCLGDMTGRMREILAKRWDGVRVSFASKFYHHHHHVSSRQKAQKASTLSDQHFRHTFSIQLIFVITHAQYPLVFRKNCLNAEVHATFVAQLAFVTPLRSELLSVQDVLSRKSKTLFIYLFIDSYNVQGREQ